MAYPTITNTFATATTGYASLFNENFADFTGAQGDGTKDWNLNSITANNRVHLSECYIIKTISPKSATTFLEECSAVDLGCHGSSTFGGPISLTTAGHAFGTYINGSIASTITPLTQATHSLGSALMEWDGFYFGANGSTVCLQKENLGGGANQEFLVPATAPASGNVLLEDENSNLTWDWVGYNTDYTEVATDTFPVAADNANKVLYREDSGDCSITFPAVALGGTQKIAMMNDFTASDGVTMTVGSDGSLLNEPHYLNSKDVLVFQERSPGYSFKSSKVSRDLVTNVSRSAFGNGPFLSITTVTCDGYVYKLNDEFAVIMVRGYVEPNGASSFTWNWDKTQFPYIQSAPAWTNDQDFQCVFKEIPGASTDYRGGVTVSRSGTFVVGSGVATTSSNLMYYAMKATYRYRDL